MQNTVQEKVELQGVGLHSGKMISLSINPAAEGSGIVFVRTDVRGRDNVIPALWNQVSNTQLCTLISNADGVEVGTIEHLMSALRGLNVDNARIELDGPEVPVMDGSAMPFVEAIEEAGLQKQNAPRRMIRVLKEVAVEMDGKRVTLSPSDLSVFAGEIDFNHPKIGLQRFETVLVNGNFKHDIADCRTFGFAQEVEWMRSKGLALGGSLENAIVLDQTSVLNPEGLRRADEFIRHKLLDAIGDLYLAGHQILGAYDGFKAGHAMNNEILKALFADRLNYEIVEFYDHLPAEAARSSVFEGALYA